MRFFPKRPHEPRIVLDPLELREKLAWSDELASELGQATKDPLVEFVRQELAVFPPNIWDEWEEYDFHRRA